MAECRRCESGFVICRRVFQEVPRGCVEGVDRASRVERDDDTGREVDVGVPNGKLSSCCLILLPCRQHGLYARPWHRVSGRPVVVIARRHETMWINSVVGSSSFTG
jgi:hypothetical protein